VEVAPNTAKNPLDLDVGAALSPSVTVLSKQRNRATGGASGSAAARHRPAYDAGGALPPHALPPRSAAEVVSAAQAAAASAPPPLELPHPMGGAGVQGAMENVLGWIQNVLIVMETQAAVLEATQAQHAALRSTLAAYTSQIQTDLQTLVADFDSSAQTAAAQHQPLPLEFAALPPQPPANGGDGAQAPPFARPAPMLRQTSSNFFSVGGSVPHDGEAALHAAPYACLAPGGDETSIVYIVAKVRHRRVRRRGGLRGFRSAGQFACTKVRNEVATSKGSSALDAHSCS
jgi:hypothetical protein